MRKALITKEDELKIVEMYKNGASTNILMHEYNSSFTRIASIIRSHGVEIKSHRNTAKERLAKLNPEEVLEYYKSHLVEDCKKHFGISDNALYEYLRDNNVMKNKLKFYQFVNIPELNEYYQEHSVLETAGHFGVKECDIELALKKLCIRKNRCTTRRKSIIKREVTDEQIKEVIEYLSLKYSGEDIAKILNFTPARVSQILHNV